MLKKMEAELAREELEAAEVDRLRTRVELIRGLLAPGSVMWPALG